MATVVTRTRHRVTLYAQCVSYLLGGGWAGRSHNWLGCWPLLDFSVRSCRPQQAVLWIAPSVTALIAGKYFLDYLVTFCELHVLTASNGAWWFGNNVNMVIWEKKWMWWSWDYASLVVVCFKVVQVLISVKFWQALPYQMNSPVWPPLELQWVSYVGDCRAELNVTWLYC
jgi:hypothetical protein